MKAGLRARGALGGETLRTARLTLRPQAVTDAEVFHRLWTERDERVPAHRKLDAEGHPTVSDIATHIANEESERSDMLSVEDASTGEVYGYCGLIFEGNGAEGEPEIAFELLRSAHNRGYATEAPQPFSCGPARQAMNERGQASGNGTSPRAACSRSSASWTQAMIAPRASMGGTS